MGHRTKWALAGVVLLCSCRGAKVPERVVQAPDGTVMRDVTFRSAALARQVTYRVIAPVSWRPGERVRVVYLLHGNRQGYREWSELDGFIEALQKPSTGSSMRRYISPSRW